MKKLAGKLATAKCNPASAVFAKISFALAEDSDADFDFTANTTMSNSGSNGTMKCSRSVDSEYSDQIRDLFTKNWSAKTKGAVQTTFKITDGTLSEIIIESKGNNKEQADFIRSLLTSAKSIPVLPKEMEEKPYVWVQIEWNNDAYCINGPFFRSEPQKITW